MIYLFAGDDTKNKLKAYEKFYRSLSKGAEVFLFSRNDFDKVRVESLYSGSSLFSAQSFAIFSNIFGYEDARDFILEKLESMANSANSFIFLEGKLAKPILDAFEKIRSDNKSKVELSVFLFPKGKIEKFNTFLVANAFEKKDKLNMWIHFRQAIVKGVGMEEIAGVLFWKAKDMIIKKDFRKFSQDELKDFSSRLSFLLPQARQEGHDAEAVFERFLLEAF